MTKFIPGPLADRSWNLLRRLGYAEQKVVGEEIGFTRRIQQDAFPRYHAYTEEKDGGMVINLHLDQRGTTHGNQRAHGGEYTGMLVEREMERLVQGIARISAPPPSAPRRNDPPPPSGGGWLSRLFG